MTTSWWFEIKAPPRHIEFLPSFEFTDNLRCRERQLMQA